MENITKQEQYGKFFKNDREQLTSVIEVTKQGLKRTYKSRSGAAAKERAKRIYVGKSKRKYYLDVELTAQQLKKLRDYNSKIAYYYAAKEKGIDVEKPIEPRFKGVKAHYVEKKQPYKTQEQWKKLRDKFENIAINNYNCSGNYKPFEYYITLTQADRRIKGQTTVDAHYNAFLKAFRRWIDGKRNKDGSKFKYSMVTVKEYGAQGFHFHILLKVHISSADLRPWIKVHWQHGFYKVQALTDALGLARYIFGTSSNNLGIDVTDMVRVDERLKELEEQESDLIHLKKLAHDKGLKQQEQNYQAAIDDTKPDVKALRRIKTKRDDTVMRTSGTINKTIKIVCTDKNLWNFIRNTSEYIYSERIIISELSENTGKTYILNEIFSDYYKQNKKDGLHLYNLCKWLIAQGKAIVKR